MQVHIRLLHNLREIAGVDSFELDVPEGATLSEVKQAVVRRHPGLGMWSGAISLARNMEYADPMEVATEGDEIAFLPPVSGG